MQEHNLESQADETRTETGEKVAVETVFCTRGAHAIRGICPDAFGVPCSPPADKPIAAETRLTAEQFRKQFLNDGSAISGRYLDSMLEAFRDKSEAGLREEIERLKAQKVGCPSCGCAFTVEGEDLHRGEKAVALLERMLVADKLVTELRAKLAALIKEHEAESARYRNNFDLMIRRQDGEVWCWADDGEDHPETLACPALIQPDVVRRFVAAEAEAAALREREREMSTDLRMCGKQLRIYGEHFKTCPHFQASSRTLKEADCHCGLYEAQERYLSDPGL